MSVISAFTLPATPPSGTLTYVPLGGDGFTAPFAAYSVFNLEVTGDAGGGNARLSVTMDNRYSSLIAYATGVDIQNSSADAEVRFLLAGGLGEENVPQQNFQGDITAISATIDTETIVKTWNPTPFLMGGGNHAGRLIFAMLNVLSDVYRLSFYVYLFNIRVREVAPMGPLLWSRGAT